MNYPNQLYVAFDVCGNPFAVSPSKEDFYYHDPERIKDYFSEAVTGVLADGKVNLMIEVNDLNSENDKLRGLLAKGQGDCVYCGLPAEDIARCAHGFPGCARMDDIVNAHETAKDQEIFELKGIISGLQDIDSGRVKSFDDIQKGLQDG
jgi:hypothetical protein